MRIVNVKYIPPGLYRLGLNIYDTRGHLLLAKGVLLTQIYLDKLYDLGISEIYVEDSSTEDINIKETISPETKRNILNIITKEFTKVSSFKNEKKVNIQTKLFQEAVDSMLEELRTNKSALITLINLKTFDDYTYVHSFNVTVYALVIGMDLYLNEEKLRKLGLGAIFHDIGKMVIPIEILNKEGALTNEEFEAIKSHTTEGYKILKNVANLPAVSRHVALSHHERCDGRGYPKGLTCDQIPLFSRIVAVADVYDALTTRRPYRAKVLPHEALEIVMASAGPHLDFDLVKIFEKRVAPYPIGTTVRLTTGEIGVVKDIRYGFTMRPTIKILYDKEGNKLPPDRVYELDLIKHPSILVKEVILSIDPKDIPQAIYVNPEKDSSKRKSPNVPES